MKNVHEVHAAAIYRAVDLVRLELLGIEAMAPSTIVHTAEIRVQLVEIVSATDFLAASPV